MTEISGELLLRRLTPADLPDMVRLQSGLAGVDALHDPTTDPAMARTEEEIQNLRSYTDPTNRDKVAFGMEQNGRLVAQALLEVRHMGLFRLFKRRATIMAMYVQENLRRQGVGSALMEASKSYCRERKIGFMTVSMYNANEDAKAFYAAHGFSPYVITMSAEL